MTVAEVYAKALRLLNIRFLSEGELRRKLRERGAESDMVDQVIERLKQERFIDDERLAGDVYRYYAGKKQYGHAYIVQRLRRRYLPVPEAAERPDELAFARILARRRFSSGTADMRKIARFLQYRGFSSAVIQEVMEDFYS